MKTILLCSAAFMALQVSGLDFNDQLRMWSSSFGDRIFSSIRPVASHGKRPPHEKKPDEGVCFDRWEARGLYTLRVGPVDIGGGGEGSAEVETLRMFGFHKMYNEEEKKFKALVYPISDSEWTPESFDESPSAAADVKYQGGPLIMFGDKEHLYVVSRRHEWREDAAANGEEHHVENNILCRKYPMKMEKMDPLKQAHYRGLQFEHNALCHHYTHVHRKEHEMHGGKYKCLVDESELFLDAFDRKPVEYHAEGHLIRKEHRMKRPFLVNIFFSEFEFNPLRREEKSELHMPKTLLEVCQGEEEQMADEMEPHVQTFLESFAGIEL